MCRYVTILEQLLTVADQDLQTTVVGGGGERSSRLQDAGTAVSKKHFSALPASGLV